MPGQDKGCRNVGAIASNERFLEESQMSRLRACVHVDKRAMRTSNASSDKPLWQRFAAATVAGASLRMANVAILGGQTGDESSNDTVSARVSALAEGVMLV